MRIVRLKGGPLDGEVVALKELKATYPVYMDNGPNKEPDLYLYRLQEGTGLFGTRYYVCEIPELTATQG